MPSTMKFLQLSAMEKIFLDSDCEKYGEIDKLIALKGERVSYQIFYKEQGGRDKKAVGVKVYADSRIRVEARDVVNVPASAPVKGIEYDDFYERTAPGLYPDILVPVKDNTIYVNEYSHSLYITCHLPENIEAGIYPVKIVFSFDDEEEVKTLDIKVLNGILPKQQITYTQWFHADCIADYYGMSVFSPEYWDMAEKFIKKAAKTGVNMILTPVFTPPLDTAIGHERTTVQLVDVFYVDGIYSFGFEKLKKWIDLSKKCGIYKFEISHLFTQWGTGKAPKIIVETDNGTEKKFGWQTDAVGAEYSQFLDAFLPALVNFLREEGVYDDTYFHVSDEPDYKKDYAIYKSEYALVNKVIPAEKIIDAMADYKFYEDGLSKKPVVITLRAEGFLENGVEDMWAYYCCSPADQYYSNRLLAMPLGRTRIMGIQLYKYNIDGFLHWGYNFYKNRYSKNNINPFMVTDAGEEFAAGDSFSVYPGEDGPLESLRSEAFFIGIQDNSACYLLESYIGREETVKILEQEGQITFNKYPYSNQGIEEIRGRVNRKLEEILG